MILVTGATGEFGKHAVQQLREKGVSTSDISVLSRSEEKAISYKEDGITVKTGDYTNYDSLVKAFEGVDKLSGDARVEMTYPLEFEAKAKAKIIEALKEIVQ